MTELFHVDPGSGIPMYQQLVDEIRSAIKTGKLPAGVRKTVDKPGGGQYNN